jgi:phosphatidylserine decarboxylase
MFHKEGHRIILFSLLFTIVVSLCAFYFMNISWLRIIIQIAALIFLVLILQFFRNPRRKLFVDDTTVVAPVDGKVVVIEEVEEKEFFKGKRKQVSIFMSPINVHVTRFPVGGQIVYSKYHPGKYLVAWHPKASEENERTTVVVETARFGAVLYRQIAGALAKRIVNYAVEGQLAAQGADSGFIKFGSRVDVFLPLDAEITVKLNQNVKGGIDVIAR